MCDIITIVDSKNCVLSSRWLHRIEKMQRSRNELYLRVGRPGAPLDNGSELSRRRAVEHCVIRHNEIMPKNDGGVIPYPPSSDDIEQAISARTGLAMFGPNGPNSIETS